MRCEERSSEGGARREELGERTGRAHQPADQPANQPTSQPNFGLQSCPDFQISDFGIVYMFEVKISDVSRLSTLYVRKY